MAPTGEVGRYDPEGLEQRTLPDISSREHPKGALLSVRFPLAEKSGNGISEQRGMGRLLDGL